ncbi:MAG: type IV secretion system protein [Alphaproteobacteria bacterium]|nr:type IV secretion system protein [Alphaproteobacteria bacterium]
MADKQIESGVQTKVITGNVTAPEFLNKLDKEKETLKHKYYMWLSRFYVLTATVSIMFLISLSLALFRLAPMVTVEPFLIINQDSSSEVVRSEPIISDMPSKVQLMETFIRQYVILRNTFINDAMEMRSRWLPGGIVHYLSAFTVYDAFYKKVAAGWQDMFQDPTSKEVEIISLKKQGGEKSAIWKVDFKTYELVNNYDAEVKRTELRVRYWTASVTAYFIKERMFMVRRLLNPLGFTVVRYSQTEVEIF